MSYSAIGSEQLDFAPGAQVQAAADESRNGLERGHRPMFPLAPKNAPRKSCVVPGFTGGAALYAGWIKLNQARG